MKTKIEIESFGEHVKLVFAGGNLIAFQNLLWVCGGNPDNEATSGSVTRENLAGAVKAFRAINPFQARRGRGLWRNSPFEFKIVSQLESNSHRGMPEYAMGCHKDDPEELARERQFNVDIERRAQHYAKMN